MEHSAEPPETTWSYDLGQSIKRQDWPRFWSLILIEAGPPVAKVGGLFLGLFAIVWIGDIIANYTSKDDFRFLIIAIPIGLAVLAFGLWALFWVGLAAVAFWPMTIILVLIGGFMGHGAGALLGAVLSGIIGLIINKLADRG